MKQVLVYAELLFAAMCLISVQQSTLVQAAALNQSPIIIGPLTPVNGTILDKDSISGNYGEDLIVGEIGVGDILLSRQIHLQWMNTNDYIVDYDTGSHIISAIRIYNYLMNGPNSKAVIVSGGVGQSNLRILFQTQLIPGFKFMVNVYGH
ncbi:uncharacterized protein [Euwallacea fornicatus]|uniref:uncharacterized protein n=1 Tax=Euwallacea fornicatus TaxID=995702 RepID=UPI0033901C92